MSKVVVSRFEKKVYHEEFCPYAKRIKYHKWMSVDKAEEKGYCQCSFCHGVQGLVYKYNKLKPADAEYELSYDKVDDAFCVRTEVGFWKLIWRDKSETWATFHMNHKGGGCFDPEKSSKDLMRGSFHKQKDLTPTASISRIMTYILSHDKNYKIGDDKVEQMPRNNSKQRSEYRRTKKRLQKEKVRNVFNIFKELERGNRV